MSELRQRMIEDMQLANMSPETIRSYVSAIRQMTAHFMEPPDRLSQEQVRKYILYLTTVRKLAQMTLRVKLAAIKFFYGKTLDLDWPVLEIAKARPGRKLPDVLSRREVLALLKCIRDPKKRMCSIMIYACGLRVSEATHLEVKDIDSDRMLIKVRGKGRKERLVPLPKPVLGQLRRYWLLDRPTIFLFPGQDGKKPIGKGTIEECCTAAARECGIKKKATPHCLRHSYATHLLESRVSTRVIQEILGHSSSRTTQIYTHLTPKILGEVQKHVDDLMKDL